MPPFLRTISLFTLAVAALSAQEPVTIDVLAAAKGALLNGLTAKDFKISEDGRDQPVTSVTLRGRVPHAVVLLFDNTTISAALQGNIRAWVAQFLDASTRPDIYFEVAAIRSGAGISVLQPFTSNIAAVKTALEGTATSTRLGSVTTGATLGAIATGSSALGNSRAGGDAILQSQAMAENLRGLAESLRPIRGRKVVLFFTGGQQFAQEAIPQVDAALAAANEADVAIYAVSTSNGYGSTLAGATGGEWIRPVQSLPDELGAILQLQDRYYAVTFTSAPGDAGECHKLKIKVEGADDVYSRKSYCAGSVAPKQLESALAGKDDGSLRLSMQTPWFWSQGADRAHVDVVLDAPSAGVKVQKVKGKYQGALAVEGVAYAADGSVASRFSETVDLNFPDKKKADEFLKLPFHYENQLSLAPGKYTVKAAISPSDGVFGTASTEVTVEPRDTTKLAMGAIALSRQLANASSAAAGLPADMIEGASPLVAAGHEIVPTANMRFQKNEHIFFYTEIYEPSLVGQSPAAVNMRFRVLDKSGAVKSDSGVASVAGYVKPGKPVVAVASTVPSAKLSSGSYRLEVTALHSTGPETVVRTVDFELQ
jgi:VWFA-related protein